MTLGPVINVAIGLVMTFAVMALVVSGVTEAIAAFLQTRSNNLAAGIRRLLNDPSMNGLAGKVMAHAAAAPLSSGTASAPQPTYIDPKSFAWALVDVIQNEDPLHPLGLREAIDKIPDPQIRQLLNGIYVRVDGDAKALHAEVAGWFDNAMGRVADIYKHDIQRISFIIAVVLAALLNVDALHIARAIWATPDLVLQVQQLGTQSAESMADLAKLAAAGFPVGWTTAPALADLPAMIPGWLVTAAASMLGAPFWFDLLSRLRGSSSAPPARQAAS